MLPNATLVLGTSDWLSTRLTGQFAREHADLARSGIRKEHGPSCLVTCSHTLLLTTLRAVYLNHSNLSMVAGL